MAEDGRQALEKFKTQTFDLVLMDIQMPTMNGYEALSAIRKWEADHRKTKVPILALTAFALKEEAEKCIAAGFGAHVTKPIRKDQLMRTIKSHAA
jgi:CheY-like chemotaxis protein